MTQPTCLLPCFGSGLSTINTGLRLYALPSKVLLLSIKPTLFSQHHLDIQQFSDHNLMLATASCHIGMEPEHITASDITHSPCCDGSNARVGGLLTL